MSTAATRCGTRRSVLSPKRCFVYESCNPHPCVALSPLGRQPTALTRCVCSPDQLGARGQPANGHNHWVDAVRQEVSTRSPPCFLPVVLAHRPCAGVRLLCVSSASAVPVTASIRPRLILCNVIPKGWCDLNSRDALTSVVFMQLCGLQAGGVRARPSAAVLQAQQLQQLCAPAKYLRERPRLFRAPPPFRDRFGLLKALALDCSKLQHCGAACGDVRPKR